jgi:hypothetical protein
MSFIPQGQTNLNANSAAGVYVNILDPSQISIPSANPNILGIVGIANGGPVNKQVFFTGVSDGSAVFGLPQNATYDLMTAVVLAAGQGANQFIGVRVTDGTDTAATASILDVTSPSAVSGLTLTSLYTGTIYNSMQAIVSQGSNYTSGTPTFKITLVLPNGIGEVFDNIGGTGNAFYVNMANAINFGTNNQQPSSLVVATAGSATLAPNLTSYTLAGGTSGNTTITQAILIGADTSTPTGMYSLRNSRSSVAMLCDVTTPSNFSAQAALGAQEGIEFICAAAAGQTVSQFVTSQQTIGLTTINAKYLLGDWCYWNDTYNNIPGRLSSPQAFVAGYLAASSPEISILNKPLSLITDTQTTRSKKKYTSSDIALITSNRGDVIYNPAPGGGQYFACQTGNNMSTKVLQRGDQTTRLTYFIALSVQDGVGQFVGQNDSPALRNKIESLIIAFLQNLVNLGKIGAVNGGDDYRVTVSATDQQAQNGILQIDIYVANFPVIRTVLVNLRNGEITLNS